MPYRCKGRFYTTCFVGESEEWSRLLAEDVLQVNHRHVIFTIDEGLRDIFLVSSSFIEGFYGRRSSANHRVFLEESESNTSGIVDRPTMKQIGEHSSRVVTLNERFAEVKVDNLKVHVAMSEPDLQMYFEMTMDLSGIFYLKKTESGTWKIYNIVYDEEDYEDMLTTTMVGN